MLTASASALADKAAFSMLTTLRCHTATPPPPGSTAAPLRRATEKCIGHRDGHVVYGSSQFRAGIRAPAVGKIDEIHRLNPRTTTGAETADLLKDLTERIGATFVYAGIDVTTTPLFSGIRGAQLAARATLIHAGPLPARHGQSYPFRDLVTGIESALDLQAHRPGTLPRMTSYLHLRTAGRIGALTRLIRQAAITAISDGTEKITKNSLEAITLDHHTEQQRRPTR